MRWCPGAVSARRNQNLNGQRVSETCRFWSSYAAARSPWRCPAFGSSRYWLPGRGRRAPLGQPVSGLSCAAAGPSPCSARRRRSSGTAPVQTARSQRWAPARCYRGQCSPAPASGAVHGFNGGPRKSVLGELPEKETPRADLLRPGEF